MDPTTVDHVSLLRFIRDAAADAGGPGIPPDRPAPTFADYIAAAPTTTPAYDVRLSEAPSKENTLDRLIAASVAAGAQNCSNSYGRRHFFRARNAIS